MKVPTFALAFVVTLACGCLAFADDQPGASNGDDAKPSATEIFNRRVLPILRSEKSSSCTECHFGGVELRNYIHEDQRKTFAALREEGLIDLKAPKESKILQFIRRHTDGTDPLIAKVRAAELEAFQSWIEAAVENPELLSASAEGVSVGSELPDEVIRHMRRDRVLGSFVENFWSEIGRCLSCHSPEKNQRLLEKHGEQISWIVPHNPAATLTNLVESGNIDLDNPEESHVLLKPAGLEDHGGGPKFAPGSRTDKNYRRFLIDYAAIVKGGYQTADDLPDPAAEVTAPTEQHLRITNLPEELGQKLLRADIYRWNGSGWSETRWGTAENPIHGKKQMWQSLVFQTAPRESERAGKLDPRKPSPLPGGRYLIRIYVDRSGKTRTDRDYELGDSDFYAEVESSGPWPVGYQPPKIVSAPNVD